MSVTIRIVRGGEPGKRPDLILDKTTVLIGRGEDRDVRLTDNSVSRRHCVIEKREAQWFAIDEGSVNGTYVNGQKVSEARPIRHGDVLEVGEVVLRVGLDRPLREDAKPLFAMSLKALVNLVVVAIGVVTLLAAVAVGWFLWKSNEAVKQLTEPLSPKLTEEKTVKVFRGKDGADLTFFKFAKLAGVESFPLTITRTVPEWDLGDIWSTGIKGKEPRLFDGLDLGLAGGEQILLSGYFFQRETYIVPDASDPYGYLYLELEGWSGLGPRHGVREIPAMRHVELPHYVRTVELWPQNTALQAEIGYKGREVASFWGEKLFDPAKGNPLGTPKLQEALAPFIGKPEPVTIPFEGRYYSFYFKGCRYTATVRGSTRLLARFKGGPDALAEAFFDSVAVNLPESATSETVNLEPAMKASAELFDVIAHKERVIAGAGAVRYEDLLKARNLLLEAQRSPTPLSGEEDLRRLYFRVRNRAQEELEFCAKKAFEERGRRTADEGRKGLQSIRDFLAGYPPLTMQREDPAYPEWAWYVEETMQKAPYNTAKKG